jgi:SAM-dependent methyltransferase
LLDEFKVLDMASGCGSFVIYGLKNGFNVWGIDPEAWKLEFIKRKINELKFPIQWKTRFIKGAGEYLPFSNETFDLVSTYQTLEHVDVVNMCISEMLRVLRPGGILYIRAPDYNSFFEGHYRIFFFPKMNRHLARLYLRLRGKPVIGIENIQYITLDDIIKYLSDNGMISNVENINEINFLNREAKIKNRLPFFKDVEGFHKLINLAYECKLKILNLGRSENTINLWVTKNKPDFST